MHRVWCANSREVCVCVCTRVCAHVLCVCPLQMKCGACGQLGHMKTNKNCPLFKKLPVQVAMTEAQEEAEKESMMSRDDLVKVEGTKISFGKALIEQ